MAEIFDAYWLGYQEPPGQTLEQTPDFIDYVTLFLAGPTEESKVTTAYLCKVYGEEKIKQWVKDVRARLRFSYVMGPGPSGTTMAITNNPGKEVRVLRRRIGEVQANMQQTVEGVKQLAEATR